MTKKVPLFEPGGRRKRAVAYYRHSAEDKQENSVPIQREIVRAFAAQHNIEILHEEADEGKTGLRAERAGFQQLLRGWILHKQAPPFEYVLVRDVDRWARFQNPNEWGYYEFLCNQRGKQVVDVSIGFPCEDQRINAKMQGLFLHVMLSLSKHLAGHASATQAHEVLRLRSLTLASLSMMYIVSPDILALIRILTKEQLAGKILGLVRQYC